MSNNNKWKIGLAIGGAIIGAPLAVVAVPAVVGAIGFGAGGIAAGSVAASMMSTLGGGATAAGGIVATLQSVGAAGLGVGGILAAGGAGAGLGAGIGAVLYNKIAKGEKLSDEEQDSLIKEYENKVDAWMRKLEAVRSNLSPDPSPPDEDKYIKELTDTVSKLLNNKSLSRENFNKLEVLYYKIKSDYYCYLDHVKQPKGDFKKAEKAYLAAYRIAEDNLDAAAPLRLQIAYDTLLFYHTELHNTNEACCIAKKALEDIRSLEMVEDRSKELKQQLCDFLAGIP